jgi:hypothetical protein
MSLLENRESVVEMIRDGLSRFAATYPALPAQRAVVWFEPEHDHCALYISTDAQTPKLLPTEFDFQNFAVADAIVRSDYEERQEEFWAEVEHLVRGMSYELSSAISPRLWAVQVAFDHYNEWERSDDIQRSVA